MLFCFVLSILYGRLSVVIVVIFLNQSDFRSCTFHCCIANYSVLTMFYLPALLTYEMIE